MIGRALLFMGSLALLAVFGWLTINTFVEFLASTTLVHALVYGVGLLFLLVIDIIIFFLGVFGAIVAVIVD